MRSCDRCGSRMPPFFPRKRNAAGELLCNGCTNLEATAAYFEEESLCQWCGEVIRSTPHEWMHPHTESPYCQDAAGNWRDATPSKEAKLAFDEGMPLEAYDYIAPDVVLVDTIECGLCNGEGVTRYGECEGCFGSGVVNRYGEPDYVYSKRRTAAVEPCGHGDVPARITVDSGDDNPWAGVRNVEKGYYGSHNSEGGQYGCVPPTWVVEFANDDAEKILGLAPKITAAMAQAGIAHMRLRIDLNSLQVSDYDWGTPLFSLGTRKVAHDSGDGERIFHCPFCGAGQVVGRSDGTTECGFCKAHFTVQIQPSYSAAPQTIDGEPRVPPETPGAEPGDAPDADAAIPDEGEFELDGFEEESDPLVDDPLTRDASYMTASKKALNEDNFLAHLAVKFGNDRTAALEAVRQLRKG